MYKYFCLILSLSIVACQVSEKKDGLDLRINQLQFLGSHNSYKKSISPALMDMIRERDSLLALTLDYGHAPLQDQLDMGLRQLELDLFYDPQGGKYRRPLGQELLKAAGKNPGIYDDQGLLELPGFKLFHIQDIDYRSHYLLFQNCLAGLFQWSEKHPDHLPILILINPKVDAIHRAGLKFVNPLPFDKEALDSLDLEIMEVFPPEKLITPDDVRGDFATLEEAVRAQNWPRLDESRGKFLFVLDAAVQGEIIQTYLKGHPSLEGRLLFVNSRPSSPHAAFMVMNDPQLEQTEIQARVREGYLLRTRADANTLEARKGDYSRFEAALESGAQYISTDYYLPDPRFAHNYTIRFEGGEMVRCNPLFPNASCDSSTLDK